MNERSRLSLILRALVACVALAGISTATAAAEKRVQFDIAPQDLLTALNEFAQQSNQELLFSTDVAAAKRTQGVTGEFPPSEALRALLEGTGLQYRVTTDNTILIERTEKEPSDRRAETTSSIFRTPLVLAQAAPASQPAQQDTKSNEESPQAANGEREESDLGEIIVTGTHLRGVVETASPLFVFDQTDFDRAGAATVQQFLVTLPQNFGGAQSEDTRTISFNPSFGTAVNLRGLGSGSTLTLINGRRSAVAGSAEFVDISMIPLSAVERIEVLTDGASAIYGSDAIAGVVNFIMREGYEGAETRLRGGATTHGDGEEYHAGQSLGTRWGSGSALLSYEYYKRGPVNSTDRDFSANTLPDFGNGPIDLVPRQERNSAYLSARQELSERVEIFGDVLYSKRNADNVDWDIFALERIQTAADAKQYGGAAGITLDLGRSWLVDVTGGMSRSDSEDVLQGGSFGTPLRSSYEYKLWSADAKLSGDLFRLPGGSAKLAVGGSYRDEGFVFSIGVDSQPKKSFSSRAAFAEVMIPVVGGASVSQEIARLVLTMAGRYEEYNAFGTTFDPKFGVRWAPSNALALRATYGTSFKAPTVFQLNEFNGFNFLLDLPDPQSSTGTARVVFRLGNNPSLHEETATTWTIGADLASESAPGWKVALTYFDVEYEGRIQAPSVFFELFTDPAYAGLTTRRGEIPDSEFDALVADLLSGRLQVGGCSVPNDPVTGACPEPAANINAVIDSRETNLAGTHTSGIDLTVNQRIDSRVGTFDLGLNASYLLDYEEQVTNVAPLLEFVDTVGNPIDLRARASASWSRNGWGVTATLNYADKYSDSRFSPTTDVASWTTWDLQVSFDTGNRFNSSLWNDTVLSLTTVNLFDRDPPSYLDGFVNLGYDSANGDPFGRIISLTLTKRW